MKHEQRKPSTYDLLLNEFNTAHIPLTVFAKKYMNANDAWIKRRASEQRLPFPAFRVGGQKAPWMIDLQEAAKYIDSEIEKSKKERKAVGR